MTNLNQGFACEKDERAFLSCEVDGGYLEDQVMGTKGDVSIGNIRGRLRLRWRWSGKQQTMTIGGESPAAHSLAQSIASKIKLDILSGNYDESLKKYQIKPDRSLTVLEILDFYFRKIDKISTKHIAVRSHVEMWGDRSALAVRGYEVSGALDDCEMAG